VQPLKYLKSPIKGRKGTLQGRHVTTKRCKGNKKKKTTHRTILGVQKEGKLVIATRRSHVGQKGRSVSETGLDVGKGGGRGEAWLIHQDVKVQ